MDDGWDVMLSHYAESIENTFGRYIWYFDPVSNNGFTGNEE
jgi:hypothetical protein